MTEKQIMLYAFLYLQNRYKKAKQYSRKRPEDEEARARAEHWKAELETITVLITGGNANV